MPISRKKACEQCRLAKTRCSLDPVCLRCPSRALECKYTAGSWRASPFSRPRPPCAGQAPSLISPAFSTESLSSLFNFSAPGSTSLESGGANFETYSWDSNIFGDSRDVVSDQTFCTKSKEPIPILSTALPRHEALNDTALDFSPLSTLQYDSSGGTRLQDPQTGIDPVVTTEQSMDASATAGSQLRDSDSSSSPTLDDEEGVDIENDSTIGIYVRRLEHLAIHRRGPASERSLTARILLGQIKNYPMMLIRGSRLPPFIYPQCVLNNKLSRCCTAATGTHQCLLKPLANCAALTRMFYDRNPSNAQFLWKAMYDEQRRLYHEYHSYDVPTLLAAVQASMIYLLLQAQDAASIAKNDIASLVITVTALSSSLHFRSNYGSDIYQIPNLSQESWVIYESTRRSVSLFYVIRVVLIIRDGRPHRRCTLPTTPLPCGPDLWDHEATETWALRLHRYKTRTKSNKGLTINDLLSYLRFEHSNVDKETGNRVHEDLATWCESLGEFGTLVWMATMVDQQSTEEH
ncbi:hypothetical protein F5Y08DRAFT_317245 [Xylaria arbuscula]|nr:hypothetical protein F5Y08DRAFT_317245 [Xylaria arbuscula]